MEISIGKERGITVALGLALTLIVSPASAQSGTQQNTSAEAATEAESQDDIVVIGDTGERYTLSSDRMKSGVRVFNKFRPSLAPSATLWFKVKPGESKQLNNPIFWVQRKDERIDLPLDAEMRFTLPQDKILQGGWKLRSNQSRSLSISPVILSPGSSKESRRFGDLRLQCRVFWELLPSISGPVRIMGDAIGVCTSNKVSMINTADKPIARARVTEQSNPDIDLLIEPDGKSFRVPLYNKKIGNDAYLHLTYR